MAKIKMKQHANTYEVLTNAGFTPSQPLQYRKVLATSEQGRKYTLEVSNNQKTTLFNVDGYIITKGQKCDKLILVDKNEEGDDETWNEIFVELKGKDVSHAIDQIRETLKNPLFAHPSNKIIKARIVAASFPANKSNPIMESKKRICSVSLFLRITGNEERSKR